MRAAGAAVVAVILALPAAAQETAVKWHPWFEIGAYGSNDNANSSRGEATLWAPLVQSSRTLVFTDIRGKLFEGDEQEGNFALGYREMSYGGWNFGGWAGYDVRQTRFDNTFGQVSFGVEALHPNWDFRANGYVPTKDSETVNGFSNTSVTGSTVGPTVSLVGFNQIRMFSGGFTTTNTTFGELRELAFWGLDAEVGARVPLTITNSDELRVYAGGFYFDNDDFGEAITGPRARLEWRISEIIPSWQDSRLTLDAGYQYDEVRDSQFEGGIRLRLPFGGSGRAYAKLTAQEKRMTERLERDTDIVAETKAVGTGGTSSTTGSALVEEKVKDSLTGVQFDTAVVVANGQNLQTAATGALPNSLVIAQGGATSFGPVALLNNQTLQGGGSTINVTGVTTAQTADFTAPGSTPTIRGLGEGTGAVTVADKSHLAGLTLNTNTAGYGVYAPTSSSHIVIADSTINGTNPANLEYGIYVNHATTDIDKMLVTNVNGDSLNHYFLVEPKLASAVTPVPNIDDLTIEKVNITNSLSGFNITGAKKLTMTEILQDGGLQGVFIQNSDDVRVDDMTIKLTSALSVPNQGTGFSLFSGVNKALVTNLWVDGAYSGVTYRSRYTANKDAVFDGLRVSNSVNGFVNQDNPIKSGNLTIKNSTFEHLTGNGLLLIAMANNSNVVITNNTFNDVATTPGFYVFHGLQNTNLTGSTGNAVTVADPSKVCMPIGAPATGKIEYKLGGVGPTFTCPASP